jgi:hypothetical protein
MPTTAHATETPRTQRPIKIDRTDWTFEDYCAEGRAWALSTYPAGSCYVCNEVALNNTARDYAAMAAPSSALRTARYGVMS